MNMKTIKKLLPKIALVLVVLSVLAVVMSSCTSNTAIDTKKDAAHWEKNEANLEVSQDFLDKLLSGIGWVLGKITEIMPGYNYLLTLFVFAIFMEVVMLPFSIKQHKNSIKQAKLKPKEMAIRKKYAGRNDQATQQKVTQEIQELYQQEHFNPFGGCLPLLIQFPILIVLYWLVVDPIKYVYGGSSDLVSVMYSYMTTAKDHANPGLGLTLNGTNGSIEVFSKAKELLAENANALDGIKDFCPNGADVLTKIQSICGVDAATANFNIGDLNFGVLPQSVFENFGWNINLLLLLIPVLTFVVYFFSMKINRKLSFQPTQSADDRQQACSNKMMDITMPLMSVWMTFMVPGAVGVYWIFKSIIGVGKQFILSKVMPLPKFTEEDYKAAEKEMAGKQPKKIVKSENVGKVRSLHHIDDDDYDEKGNYVAPEKKEEPVETEEKIKDNEMTQGAALKDESDKSEKKSFFNFGKKNKKDDK